MGYILANNQVQKCVRVFFNSRRSLVSNAINKVLVANRGEIACRVTKTAKRLGIKVVAVYSDADADALHVALADEAYHIGPANAHESYLRGDKLLKVANLAGCQALHPGYGFLSENADFAETCREAGVIFIGPPASAIRDMGCKSTSKKIMEHAGVPVVKGYHGNEQADERLKLEAKKIGYPVMLKALKGGGGKGMRVVLTESEFDEQLASARNEANKAFGDTAMLVEAFVQNPRHVEVQVFGDTHGNYVHLHERDCSVQRRHQKVIEEAPAPGLSEEVRRGLGETAVKAAQAVGYVGAGTVEFILDADTLRHYFMEMNTRLQVEHPVTELITGTDLVEWQFRVASGEPLPLRQDEILATGHAFEARVYAEDPKQGFLPQAGTLHHLRFPPIADSVRVDTGVRAGDDVPVFYDPLIAKLIVWGSDRYNALKSLHKSLASLQVSGVPTNVNFLLALAKHAEFQSGQVHTNFITQHEAQLLPLLTPSRSLVATAIAAKLFRETHSASPNDPFWVKPGFRVNHNYRRQLEFIFEGEKVIINIEYQHSGEKKVTFSAAGKTEALTMTSKCKAEVDGAIFVETVVDGHVSRADVFIRNGVLQIYGENGVSTFEELQPTWMELAEGDQEEGGNQTAASPMPGVVDQVLVKTGDIVVKNQPLVTVIAMKMEYLVRAPADGIVSEVIHKSGDAVPKGAILVRFQEEAKSCQAES